MNNVEFNSDQVLVFKDRLNELEDSALMLKVLEECGVDNWTYYEYALEQYREEKKKAKEPSSIIKYLEKTVSLAVIIGKELFTEVILKNNLAEVKNISVAPYKVRNLIRRKATDINAEIEELVNELCKSEREECYFRW